MLGGISARRRGLLFILIATVLWSSAGLFARMIDHLDAWTMLGGRAMFGGTFILLVAVTEWRRGTLGPRFGLGPLAPLIIALAAVAISCYVLALKLTTIAEVMVIYATLPFVTAGLALVVNGERTDTRTLVAAGVALAGVAIMVAGAIGTGRLLGEIVSFVMTAGFGMMIVLQRRHPGMSMTSINGFGALAAGAFGLSMSPHPPVSAYDLAVLAIFGLTTVCVAFIMFMEGAKHIPSAEAGLLGMLDVILGPLWVYLVFDERPGLLAIIGGVLVLGALVWRLAPEIGRGRAVAVAR